MWLIGAALLLIVLFFGTIVLFSPPEKPPLKEEDSDLSINAAGGIVTIQKVGKRTSVVIYPGVSDHWEGSEGVTIPPCPIETTKSSEPELYSEYMSPQTCATRKRDIADRLYNMGYTLPYISGLYEQSREEELQKKYLPSGRMDG